MFQIRIPGHDPEILTYSGRAVSETDQYLSSSSAQKPVSPISSPFLNSKGQVQTVANQGREGDTETREEKLKKQKQDNSAALQGKVLVLPQVINRIPGALPQN